MDIREAFTLINKGISENLSAKGFSPVYSDSKNNGELPVTEDGKQTFIDYNGKMGYFRINYLDDKFYFQIQNDEKDGKKTFTSVSASLFDKDVADEVDIKYIINEFNDCIDGNFSVKKVETTSKGGIKLPPSVSKAAAKNGSSYYDPATLASRYTVMYPELRDKYKANIEKYGMFLPDEFFKEYGYAAIETIKKNDKQQMKKLFNMFNEIYLDGTNETQGIITVTILSQLNNDTELLANCVDYMDPELASTVIHVNKYLASRSGRKAVKLLNDPPSYKPPKKKKKNLMSAALGQ